MTWRPRTFAENKAMSDAFERGFEKGTRAGIAADRFQHFACGALLGALVALIYRAL